MLVDVPGAVDVNVPVATSTSSVEAITLPVCERSGVLKYAKWSLTMSCSTYSLVSPPSKSNTERPMSADDGRMIVEFASAHPYARRLASLRIEPHESTTVTVSPRQLHPRE